MSDYEKQRLSRIRENKERLEALGLPSLYSSLSEAFSSSTKINRTKIKGKKKKREEDDEEYKPSSDEEETLNCEDNNDNGDEQFVEDSATFEQKGKKKSISNASYKKKSQIKRSLEDSNQYDDDSALQQAIALSLGRILEERMEADVDQCEKKDKANMQSTTRGKKNAHMNRSRIQLTEDEVIAYFFSFDERGKGHISFQDLERMVLAHDFSWSKKEIASMIESFDRDKDGKLSLEDFRAIVCRCNMLQQT